MESWCRGVCRAPEPVVARPQRAPNRQRSLQVTAGERLRCRRDGDRGLDGRGLRRTRVGDRVAVRAAGRGRRQDAAGTPPRRDARRDQRRHGRRRKRPCAEALHRAEPAAARRAPRRHRRPDPGSYPRHPAGDDSALARRLARTCRRGGRTLGQRAARARLGHGPRAAPPLVDAGRPCRVVLGAVLPRHAAPRLRCAAEHLATDAEPADRGEVPVGVHADRDDRARGWPGVARAARGPVRRSRDVPPGQVQPDAFGRTRTITAAIRRDVVVGGPRPWRLPAFLRVVHMPNATLAPPTTHPRK